MKAVLVLLFSLLSFSATDLQVKPTVETDPVSSFGDAADDTTVWVHPTDPSKSLIIGTNKQVGLIAYNLDGKKVSEASVGKINNIDSRHGLKTSNGSVHLMAGSNRSKGSIDFYTVDVNSSKINTVASLSLGYDPYGICVGYLPGDMQESLSVFVTAKDGTIDHWEIYENKGFHFQRVQKFKVRSTVEGCALNDETGDLFVGEESVGLWRIQLANGNVQTLVDKVKNNGGRLQADVEGVTIYKRPGSSGYLLVSSQGDDSFHIYDMKDFSHRGRFKIIQNGSIDGVVGTDGIDATSLDLGSKFPNGFFVAQDDQNTPQKQNFKVVDWNEIRSKMREFDSSFDQ